MAEHPILFSGAMVRAIPDAFIIWNNERRITIDDQEVTRLFYEGRTAAEIAAKFGCSTYPVSKSMRRLGLRRAAKRRNGVGVGSQNPQWKGGRRLRSDGYVIVWTPDGEQLEHRVVAASKLGRQLTHGEVIHHLDGVRSNNAPENLTVLSSQSDHVRMHLNDMHAARYKK